MTWRRVKRLVWLAAWSFWAFIGWRLYVEFPRSVDYPITTLTPEKGETVVGAIHGEPLLVTYIRNVDGARVKLWNVELGAVVRDWAVNLNIPEELQLSGEHGVVVARRTTGGDSFQRDTLAVDLRSGAAVKLQRRDEEVMGAVFHPTKPWAVVESRPPNSDALAERQIVVFDVRTGEPVTKLPLSTRVGDRFTHYRPQQFVDGADLLLLKKIAIVGPRGPAEASLVVRDLARPLVEERVVCSDFTGSDMLSRNGVIAFDDIRETDGVPRRRLRVVDARSGVELFANESAADRRRGGSVVRGFYDRNQDNQLAGCAFALSADGSVLLDFRTRKAFDVRSGRLAWTMPDDSYVVDLTADNDRIEVLKDLATGTWARRWEATVAKNNWRLSLRRMSRSVHDLKTGSVRYRGSGTSLVPMAPGCDWRIDEVGHVYRCDARVSWLEIGCLQTLLALPLLLVYSYRWWGWRRRKRP